MGIPNQYAFSIKMVGTESRSPITCIHILPFTLSDQWDTESLLNSSYTIPLSGPGSVSTNTAYTALKKIIKSSAGTRFWYANPYECIAIQSFVNARQDRDHTLLPHWLFYDINTALAFSDTTTDYSYTSGSKRSLVTIVQQLINTLV